MSSGPQRTRRGPPAVAASSSARAGRKTATIPSLPSVSVDPSNPPSLSSPPCDSDREPEQEDQEDDVDADADANLDTSSFPPSLDRYACLRCLKYLGTASEFSCVFPADSSKCMRCTRLKEKCPRVPHVIDSDARTLLALQAQHDAATPASRPALRKKVVAAAHDLAVRVRLEVPRAPRTQEEIMLALLRGQEEIIRLLRGMQPPAPPPALGPVETGRVTKGKGRGKGSKGKE